MPRRDPVKNRYPNRVVIVIDKTNKGSFGFNDEKRGSMSCSQKVWHDKDPSVLKNFRCSIFCPFPSIVTSLNERNILERDEQQDTINQCNNQSPFRAKYSQKVQYTFCKLIDKIVHLITFLFIQKHTEIILVQQFHGPCCQVLNWNDC